MLSAIDVANFFIWRTNDDEEFGITVTSEDGKKLVREIMEMLADPVGFQKRAAAAFQRELAERSREDAA